MYQTYGTAVALWLRTILCHPYALVPAVPSFWNMLSSPSPHSKYTAFARHTPTTSSLPRQDSVESGPYSQETCYFVVFLKSVVISSYQQDVTEHRVATYYIVV